MDQKHHLYESHTYPGFVSVKFSNSQTSPLIDDIIYYMFRKALW